MKAAASEGCRLLSTKTDASADQSSYEDSIRRHLGSIPQQENFHVHQSGCSWSITLEGNEESDSVKVSIENQLELLILQLKQWASQTLQGILSSELKFREKRTVAG